MHLLACLQPMFTDILKSVITVPQSMYDLLSKPLLHIISAIGWNHDTWLIKSLFTTFYNIVPHPLLGSQGYPRPSESFRALTQTRVGLGRTNGNVLFFFFPPRAKTSLFRESQRQKRPNKCRSKSLCFKGSRWTSESWKEEGSLKKKEKPMQERQGGLGGGGGLSKWVFYIPCVQLRWKVTPDK